MLQNSFVTKICIFIVSIIVVFYIVKNEHQSLENFNSPSSSIGLSSNKSPVSNPVSTNTLTQNQIITGSNKSSTVETQTVLGENIVNLYKELLQRQPVSLELSAAMSKIMNGLLTMEGLRRQIIDTDEYGRLIKMQSNELNPELKKMISDQEVITHAASIYYQEFNKLVTKIIELPLRDIYIYLEYNDYALRAMLRDSKYTDFENDIRTQENLNKPLLISTFLKYFNVDYLKIAGTTIFTTNPDLSMAGTGIVNAGEGSGMNGIGTDGGSGMNGIGTGGGSGTNGIGPGPGMSNYRPLSFKGLFDKDAAADNGFGDNKSRKVVPLADDVPYSMTQTAVNLKMAYNDMTTDNYGTKRIPIHKHDMVLIPEFAWTVPQEFPPVCTTLGQKPLVQPVMTNSALLLGTPLGDAKNTQVGSIMPKFEYKEYVSIPN